MSFDENAKAKFGKGFIIGMVIMLSLIAIGVYLYFVKVNSDAALDKFNTSQVEVTIEKGSTPTIMASLLVEKKIIKNNDVFLDMVKKMNAAQSLKAGTYLLSPSMKPSQIVDIIANGKESSNGIKVIIPEGFNNKEIIKRLVSKGIGTEKKYMEELKNGKFTNEFVSKIDRSHNLEGYLFPATYSFDKNATEHDVIQKMLDTFDSKFTKEYYDAAKAKNLTLDEVITLASIVEKEVRREDERKNVASVFLNRLKIKMPLQSCATVQYILGENKPVLSIADTQIQSPYNTYQNPGLTPGPIASPGTSSIEAVIYAGETEYLYFVVKNLGDGSHYFSKTYKEHKEAIVKSKENLKNSEQ